MKTTNITKQVAITEAATQQLHKEEVQALDHFATDDRATDAKTRGLTDITPAHHD